MCMKGGSWSLVGMSCFPSIWEEGTPVIPAAVSGPAPDAAKRSHQILARPPGAPLHVEFQDSGLVKSSFKGCQPQTEHFPSICPWLLMSRMVNILPRLFILLPSCNFSCAHSRARKAIFSDIVFHWQKERKKKSLFFCLDLCCSFTVGEAKCSLGSSVIYQHRCTVWPNYLCKATNYFKSGLFPPQERAQQPNDSKTFQPK